MIKYQPTATLYLTYIPLNDFGCVLRDTEKTGHLCKNHGDEVISLIKNFLLTHPASPFNEAVAFIRVDMKSLTAGYKCADDNDGGLKPIQWSQTQVKRLAVLFDRFLENRLWVRYASQRIESADYPIANSWEDIRKTFNNPYIPEEDVANLLLGFRVLLSKKSKADEFKALKTTNISTYNAIQKWKTRFDSSQVGDYAAKSKSSPGIIEVREIGAEPWKRNVVYDYSTVIKEAPGIK
ncbi:MAG: hypothetical protein AB1512_03025 [Thermodesulfobacteriota bacterium]